MSLAVLQAAHKRFLTNLRDPMMRRNVAILFGGKAIGLGIVWGTLSLGLFATGQFSLPTPTGADVSAPITGLFYGGGVSQLGIQLVGSLATLVVTLVASFALMYGVKATGTLRVSAEGEMEGLDLHEHGAAAYPEYALAGGNGCLKRWPSRCPALSVASHRWATKLA